MLWVLVVILVIVLIISISKGSKKKNLEIEKLRKDLDSKPEPAVTSLSVSDELAKLKKLLDDGVISPEDFEKQKTKLLS